MNSITIGQYIKGDSWIYKLDPRMKIILTFVLMVAIFIIPTLYLMGIACAIFLIMFLTTRISLFRMLKGLRPILFLLIFTFILQLIYNQEGKLYASIDFTFGLYQALIIIGLTFIYFFTKKYIPLRFSYFLLYVFAIFFIQYIFTFNKFNFASYTLNVYSKGLQTALFIFLRIILMIGITSLLTFSTMPTDINNGLEAVMSPLKVIKVPVGVISMTLSLTLRFIPTLLSETTIIMKAQASRGVDFEEGKLKDKIMQIISLIIPMFVISLRRADDLANAMISRGYVIEAKRTKLDELKLKIGDYIALGLSLMFLGFTIWYNVIV